jgi:hypothetical protein
MGNEAPLKLSPLPFGVRLLDPGFVYVIEDRGRYKIGRTIDGEARLTAAKTWLPDMKLIGLKPFWNHQHIEETLHVGFADCWYDGEWYEILDEGYRDLLVDGFSAFSDTDRGRNSVDFIYWVNGSGMNEMTLDQSRRGVSRRRFLKEMSGRGK